jgi:predicted component of type VI protein secretion system
MPSNLFDIIMGGGDQTPDAAGLTNADRSQIGFSGLGQLGALLLAAGQPMWGNERARYLAGLGTIPGNMQEQRIQAVQQRRLAQQTKSEASQSAATQAIRDMANDPSAVEGLNPQQQALAKAGYLSGSPQAVVAVQKEAREASQPIPLGNGMFWDRTTNTAINPITGMRFQLGANGQIGSALHLATGNPASEADTVPDEDGFYSGWLQNAVPKQFHEQVKAIAEGRQKLPSAGGRDAGLNAQLINWARQYNPKLDQTTYSTRDKAAKDYAPSGAVGKTIVSLNTLLQHTEQLRDAALKLDNTSVPIWNSAKNMFETATGGSGPTGFDQIRGVVSRELDNLLSGGRVTLAETEEIRKNLNSSQSPEQIQRVIDQLVHLAEARLQSSTQQGQMALGKKGMQALDEQLKNPVGLAAIKSLQEKPLPGSERAKAMETQRQAAPKAPPSEADIAYLKANPQVRAKFEARFGPADQYLK